MPRLLLFAPCDNVLLSGPSDSVSLIVVINQITFPSELPKPLPEKPHITLRWFVFSQWEFETSEAGFEFEQKIELIGEDKNVPLLENVAAFKAQEGKPVHRMISQLFAFPIAAAGWYRLHMAIRAKGGENWRQVGDYPIQLVHAAPAQVPH
jgi:hypothetical protein